MNIQIVHRTLHILRASPGAILRILVPIVADTCPLVRQISQAPSLGAIRRFTMLREDVSYPHSTTLVREASHIWGPAIL